jgi:hypothetical protein
LLGKDFHEATALLLYCFDDEYHETYSQFIHEIISKKQVLCDALKIARDDGLSYYFCKRLLEEGVKPTYEILKELDEQKRNVLKFRETLSFLSQFLKNERLDFRFIKLYRSVPYIPRDIDVLIKDYQFDDVLSAFNKIGADIKVYENEDISCKIGDLVKVDLYKGFYYFSSCFIDTEFLWKKPRIVHIQDICCQIPNSEADFLSTLIHALFGHGYLSLLDFLYAKSLLKESLDLNAIENHVKDHGWFYAYKMLTNVIQDIQRTLCLDSKATKHVNFPYRFPLNFIFKAFQSLSFQVDKSIKFTFIVEKLIDDVFYEYQLVHKKIPIIIPEWIKKSVNSFVPKIKSRYRAPP